MLNRWLSAQFVRETLGFPGDENIEFSAVVTDSRNVAPGCLFVAIPGDRFDGHSFIAQAIEKGAKGILATVDRPETAAARGASAVVYAVTDSVEGYRRLGAAWRARFGIPVIAIAGSEGKTTTKDFLAAILSGKWPSVLKTQGSQNGFVGIPMTLLELAPEHGAAVIEVGIDEIGAMARHLEIVRPTAAVLTSIGPEHLEKLRDVATVAREEGLALRYTAEQGGTVAISLDDPGISPHWDAIRARPGWEGAKVGYSISPDRHPTSGEGILHGTPLASMTELEVTAPRWGRQVFPQPLPGRHNASNLMAALAIAYSLGLSPEEVRAGLARFQGAEGRSQVRALPGGAAVICDYYNANPTSIRAGISLFGELARQRGGGRHICLADMLELGPDEERFHRALAAELAPFARDGAQVYLYGPRMKWLAAELAAAGLGKAIAHFETHAELAARLKGSLAPTDTVLLKGSRGMKMEQVWKALGVG